MLRQYPLKTYQYACARLGAITPVTLFLEYYTDALPDYPLDAKIPFAHTSHGMLCPNAIKCGILANKTDGVDAPWHLCPAHAIVRELKPLPELSE